MKLSFCLVHHGKTGTAKCGSPRSFILRRNGLQFSKIANSEIIFVPLSRILFAWAESRVFEVVQGVGVRIGEKECNRSRSPGETCAAAVFWLSITAVHTLKTSRFRRDAISERPHFGLLQSFLMPPQNQPERFPACKVQTTAKHNSNYALPVTQNEWPRRK